MAPLAPHEGEAAWQAAASPSGYAWWYVDASDGKYALSAIFFAGSVFSPTYASRVRRGKGDTGLDHPAVNLAIYKIAPRGKARQICWVMNEHLPASLVREPGGVQVGQSRLSREPDGTLAIDMHERTTRFFAVPGVKVRGRILLQPVSPNGPVAPIRLSRDGAAERHHWQPLLIGGRARVELTIGGTPLTFEGSAYHDRNYGTGRLEGAFSRWCWAHGSAPAGDPALVLYRTCFLDGGGRSVVLRRENGRVSVQAADLPPGEELFDESQLRGAEVDDFRWMPVPARFQAQQQSCERLAGGLLDTPFYARFRVGFPSTSGSPLTGFGEYLDLDRFRSRGIQFLLRYKTRRVG